MRQREIACDAGTGREDACRAGDLPARLAGGATFRSRAGLESNWLGPSKGPGPGFRGDKAAANRGCLGHTQTASTPRGPFAVKDRTGTIGEVPGGLRTGGSHVSLASCPDSCGGDVLFMGC